MQNDKAYYVYQLFNHDWNEPFYIGKGKGNRSSITSPRNPVIRKIIDRHKCSSKILFDGLTEEDALNIEKQIKIDLISEGHPIIDFEIDYVDIKAKNAKEKGLLKAKKEGRIGRPKKALPDNWDVIYRMFINKEISKKQAMEYIGVSYNTFNRFIEEYESENIL